MKRKKGAHKRDVVCIYMEYSVPGMIGKLKHLGFDGLMPVNVMSQNWDKPHDRDMKEQCVYIVQEVHMLPLLDIV